MQFDRRGAQTLALSLAAGGVIFITGTGHGPANAKTATHPAKPAATADTKLVSKGSALAAKYGCTRCHGASLAGSPGRAPSLRVNGVLREYNAKTWARVLDTGVTNDGGMVHKPMPVYHMPAGDAAAIYAYAKSLKPGPAMPPHKHLPM